MIKKKIKSPAKKKAKAPVKAKAKSKAPAKTKGKAAKAKAPVKNKAKATKAKATVKSKAKAPVKAKAKAPAAKAKSVKRKAVVSSKPRATAKTKKVTKPVTTPTILPHGPDQHFIPSHDKNAIVIHPDGHLAENQFHHNEEVALHQENQKVKANLATRMGRKPIFRNTRRG